MGGLTCITCIGDVRVVAVHRYALRMARSVEASDEVEVIGIVDAVLPRCGSNRHPAEHQSGHDRAGYRALPAGRNRLGTSRLKASAMISGIEWGFHGPLLSSNL